MRILFTCGGTAGHINPAVAVAGCLRKRDENTEVLFIGAALILVLFALLIVRGYWLALHMRDKFSCLVCAGITTLRALQVFLNVAVVTNLIPCTGISLPFFSYGGTALLIQMAEMGIILSASRDVPAK